MRVLFFADGSTPLGAGHQVRTGVLAHALAARGHSVAMACRTLSGSSDAWAWRGLDVAFGPADLSADEAIRRAVRDHPADVVVVDHYSASRDVLHELAASTRLVLIDDVPGDRFPSGALVVNPAPSLGPRDYPHQVPALGPAHALIREEFAAAAMAPVPARSGVLVMPGSGVAEWLGPVIDALLARTTHAVAVVTGAYRASAHDELAARRDRHRDRLTWHSGLSATELAALMRRASVGVLSASTVVFEAAAAGLPIVAIVTADNQVHVAHGLRLHRVPVFDGAPAEDVVAALDAAASADFHVDGLGPARVARRIEERLIPTGPATLRPFTWDDGPRLLEWVNEAGARRGSFSDRPIERGEHEAWLAARLMDPEARLWIVEEEGREIGTLRLERRGPDAVVSITVALERRGQGCGRRMLEALEAWTRASGFADTLIAYVREDNAASRALFARAGYVPSGTEVRNGRPAQVLTRKMELRQEGRA
jgi:UDP-2,4-diacetamido-2,4,6-trideoxy-beta-L-altropyranose hydrolase